MKIGKVLAVTLISGTAYAGAAQAVPTFMRYGAQCAGACSRPK